MSLLTFYGNDGTAVTIDPDHGGAVRQIRLVAQGETTPLDILSPGTSAEPEPEFRGCFLFPFNDRIPDGVYHFHDREHRLPINDHEFGDAIHGFAYQKQARVSGAQASAAGDRGASSDPASLPPAGAFADAGATGATVATGAMAHVEVDVADEPGYPFRVRLAVDIALSGPKAALRFTATNIGREAAPVTIGWHPYFCLPGSVTDELRLRIPASGYVPVDKKLVPTAVSAELTGTELDFTGSRLIGPTTIDIAYGGISGAVTLESRRHRLRLRQDRALFGYVQVFTPPTRDSIAIEPVSAATNAFNWPELGRRVLEPGQSVAGSVEITVEAPAHRLERS